MAGVAPLNRLLVPGTSVVRFFLPADGRSPIASLHGRVKRATPIPLIIPSRPFERNDWILKICRTDYRAVDLSDVITIT